MSPRPCRGPAAGRADRFCRLWAECPRRGARAWEYGDEPPSWVIDLTMSLRALLGTLDYLTAEAPRGPDGTRLLPTGLAAEIRRAQDLLAEEWRPAEAPGVTTAATTVCG